jgi:hypothetical protein
MQRRDGGGVLKDARGGNLGRPGHDFELLMAIDTGTLGSMFVNGSAVFENRDIDVGSMTLDQAAIGALPLEASHGLLEIDDGLPLGDNRRVNESLNGRR